MNPTPVDTTFRDWRSYAACAAAPDPDAFFAPPNSSVYRRARETYCGACPVLAECLALAVETGSRGLFAGTTPTERVGRAHSRKDLKREVLAEELRTSRDRQICELTKLRHSAGEISVILGTNERTVGRVLDRNGVEAYK
jgi:hypothetical protein